ncbi:MAG: hypothetical protein P9L95_02725 [Candidatus Tenebribacter mawsonii]|nr:hypothetical protein [Candidatus Tenebribacter mawsonii]
MFAAEIGKMLVTNSSTAKQEEKQEERGSCQTLCVTKRISDLISSFKEKSKLRFNSELIFKIL